MEKNKKVVVYTQLNIDVDNKLSLLKKASEYAFLNGLIKNQHLFFKSLIDRELEITTGIGHSIAFPHALGKFVEKPFILFIRTKNKINFNSIDKEKVDMFFIIGNNLENNHLHLYMLSTLAKNLQDSDLKNYLRKEKKRNKINDKLISLF